MANLIKQPVESVAVMDRVVKLSDVEIYKTVIGEGVDEVIIGNTDSPSKLTPQVEFTKWNKECSLKIICPPEICSPVVSAVAGGELAFDSSKTGFYFKTVEDDNNIFKFGLLLYDIPPDDLVAEIDGEEHYQWEFKLEGWEDYDFFYQPPLTEEYRVGEDYYGHVITSVSATEVYCEDKRVVYRPDSIVGSYAIYHKTKKDNQYQTGKFGHDHRPRFLSADGDIQWGKLSYDLINGVRKVAVLKSWVDNVKPTGEKPIKANDTLGYTTQNTEATAYANSLTADLHPAAGSGILTKLSIITKRGASDGSIALAIYNDDGETPGSWFGGASRLDYATEVTTIPATTQVVDSNVVGGASISSGTNYILAYNFSVDSKRYYDSANSTVQENWKSSTYVAPLANPFPSGTNSASARWSIYATYTPVIQRYVDTDSGTDDGDHGTGTGSSAYKSLSYALSANAQDLTSSSSCLVITCAGATADSVAMTASSYTCNSSYYIIINGNSTSGVYDATKYHLSASLPFSDSAGTISAQYTRINQLQFLNTGISASSGWGTGMHISRCIFKGNDTASAIMLSGGGHGTNIYNNIIYGYAGEWGGMLLNCNTCNIYNNVVYDCNGSEATGGGINAYSSSQNHLAKNNLCFSNKVDFANTSNFSSSSRNNISSDTTGDDFGSGGIASVSIIEDTDVVSLISGAEDLRIKGASSCLYNAGVDVFSDATLPVITDIEGKTLTVRNDIGADEYVSSAASGPLPMFRYS